MCPSRSPMRSASSRRSRFRRSSSDRKSTRLNSSHSQISYAVFCLKKKKLVASCLSKEVVSPLVYFRSPAVANHVTQHLTTLCFSSPVPITGCHVVPQLGDESSVPA